MKAIIKAVIKATFFYRIKAIFFQVNNGQALTHSLALGLRSGLGQNTRSAFLSLKSLLFLVKLQADVYKFCKWRMTLSL